MLIAPPATVCDLVSQLRLLPLVLGAVGTICWIICGLPYARTFSEVLRETEARRGKGRTDRPGPAPREDSGPRSRDEAIGEALLEHMAMKNDFGDAVAQQIHTAGRTMAGHLAIAMYVFATLATLLNAHYESLLPPGTCR